MQTTKVKKDVEVLDLLDATENLKELIKGAKWYFDMQELDFVITSIYSDRKNVKSVSTTHEDFRAIDIRSKHLSEKQIKRFIQFCEDNYSHIGAISAKNNVVRPCVYHDNHFHLQVRREKTLIDKMKFWK